MGLLMSVIVNVALIWYACYKFSHLVTKYNPNVYTEIVPGSFSVKEEAVNLTKVHLPGQKPFKFAFAMRNYLNYTEIRNAPNMVEWTVHFYVGDGRKDRLD